jgi:hypothetical protein
MFCGRGKQIICQALLLKVVPEKMQSFHSISYQAKMMQKPFKVREVFLVLTVLVVVEVGGEERNEKDMP